MLLAAAVPAAQASSSSPFHPAAKSHVSSPSVATTTFSGFVDASLGLNARSHASKFTNVTLKDPIIATYPQNTQVHILCVFTGPAETGPFGPTTVWDAIDYFQEPGGTLTFYSPIPPYAVSSDAWINTGTNNPVAPPCSST
jgi:hypothetical protein